MNTEEIDLIRYSSDLFLSRNFDLSPWKFLSKSESEDASNYLQKKYVGWKLYCFARSEASDDYACFAIKGRVSEKYIFIHDFSEPGFEFYIGSEKNTFGDLIQKMIVDVLFIERPDFNYDF